MKCVYIIPILLFVSACSDKQQEVENDHVWKQQTEALEQAKQVEQMLQDNAQRIDQQTH